MTPEEQAAVTYLQSAQAIRDRTRHLFHLCQTDRLDHFACDLTQLDTVATYVIETIQQQYPDFDIPFHSRWRHFNAGGINRLGQRNTSQRNAAPKNTDKNTDKNTVPNNTAPKNTDKEAATAQMDLAIISVLLDAGAGPQWHYQDFVTQHILERSEGLAVASLRAFEQGFFSSDAVSLHQVDAAGLQQLTTGDLVQAFQVTENNPLVGLSGRLTLLHQLGRVLANQPERFGASGRPGHLLEYWLERYGPTMDAGTLLTEVLKSFSSIWPGRVALGGINLGDVWPHPALIEPGVGANLIPFHKLSQWLTYSLVEPMAAAGITVTNLNTLTGLAEYRNGGLCVDLGLLVPKHSEVTRGVHLPSAAIVVEWRALTIVMLDLISERVRALLKKTPDQLPLIKVLEGGTWAAGRRIARQLRPATGVPPIVIQSDGTVF